MIDLHTHVLPGIDDGPAQIDGSIRLAAAAAAQGVTALAATPHVRDDYPTTAEAMRAGVATVSAALAAAGVEVEVLPGAEIAFDWLHRLGEDELRALALAGGNHLLVEMPFFGWPLDALEQVVRLREAGLTVVLAHPERSVAAQSSPERLAELVRAGALVQVTAGSLVGRFGAAAERAATRFLAAGLVHLVATDAHAAGGRGADLLPALERLHDAALARWLGTDVPRAVVEGAPSPPRPAPAAGGWRPRRPRRPRS